MSQAGPLEVKITEEGKDSIKLSIKGIGVELANALRRAAINSVETFAIDTVTFYENSSSMFDEYIAHRIGLVPIKTPKGFHKDDKIMFGIESEGPKTVMSEELKSEDKDVGVVYGNIPIIKLDKGQRLRVECNAIMGNAKRHAKFQPGITSYDQENSIFKFYIESFGQMPPKEIIKRACDTLIEEMKDVSKVSKKL